MINNFSRFIKSAMWLLLKKEIQREKPDDATICYLIARDTERREKISKKIRKKRGSVEKKPFPSSPVFHTLHGIVKLLYLHHKYTQKSKSELKFENIYIPLT